MSSDLLFIVVLYIKIYFPHKLLDLDESKTAMLHPLLMNCWTYKSELLEMTFSLCPLENLIVKL